MIPIVLSPFQSYGNIPFSIVMNLTIIIIDTLTMYNSNTFSQQNVH